MKRRTLHAIPLFLLLVPAGAVVLALFAEKLDRLCRTEILLPYLVYGALWAEDGTLRFNGYHYAKGNYEPVLLDEKLNTILIGPDVWQKMNNRPGIQIGVRPSLMWKTEIVKTDFHPGAVAQTPQWLTWWNGPAGVIEEYSLKDFSRIAIAGPEEVVAGAAQPTSRFQDVMAITYPFITTRNAVYVANGPALETHEIYRGEIAAQGTAPSVASLVDGKYIGCTAIVTGATVIVLDMKGNIVQQHPWPAEAPGKWASIWPCEGRRVGYILGDEYGSQLALLLDGAGNLLRREELSFSRIQDRLNGPPRLERVNPSLWLCPSGLIAFGLVNNPDQRSILVRALVVVSVLWLVLSFGIVWHQRRRGVRGWPRVGWPLLTFLLGLLGVMAYVVAHWDRRVERCPQCAGKRPITEETCPHCHAPWPAPARLGIEMIEPEQAA